MKCLKCAILFSLLLTSYAIASTPVPKIYHDYSIQVSGCRFGIIETDRVVDGEFRRELASGRQMLFDVGPFAFVLPISLIQFGFTFGVFVFATYVLLIKRKKRKMNYRANE